MFKSRPIFQSFAVTKPVVTQTTNGYQTKDLDKIFPKRPCAFLYSRYFVFYSLLKSDIFQKIIKVVKNHNFYQRWHLDFWTLFFQTTLIQRWIKIFSWNQSHMILNNQNFYVVKADFRHLHPFLSYSKLKTRLPLNIFSRFLRDDSPVIPCSADWHT